MRKCVVVFTASILLVFWTITAQKSPRHGELTAVEISRDNADLVPVGTERLPEYPDGKGHFAFSLPPGEYRATFEDLGRDAVGHSFSVQANKTVKFDIKVAPASSVDLDIRDEQGHPSPARVQCIGLDGTPTPNLGSEYRAHGSDHQYFTHDGSVRQQVAPGKYLLRITRGPEFDLHEETVEVGKGRTTPVQVVLKHAVNT